MGHGGIQYPEMLKGKAILLCSVAYPYPVYVALPHMPDALGLIDIGWIFLSITDSKSFCIFLPATSMTIPRGICPPFLIPLLPLVADDYDLVVFDLIKLPHPHPFECRGSLAAELYEHIFLPYPLTFKCRTVGNRYGGLFHSDFQSSHLDCLLHDLGVVKLLINLFIGTHTGGMYDRHIGITHCRESHINCTCSCGPFDVIKGTQHYGKGKDPVFLVLQMILEVSGFFAAKYEGCPDCPVKGIKGMFGVRAKRDDPCIPAQFNTLSQQLFRNASYPWTDLKGR